MMRFLVLAIVIAACAAQLPPAMPDDFTTNITVDEGGVQVHGFMVYDVTGRRMMRQVNELNQTTYIFQGDGEAVTYTYMLTNSGCTCTISPSTIVESIFLSLTVSVKSSKPCNGTGGELWMPSGLYGLRGISTRQYCISGTTPKYIVDDDYRVTSFTNFVAQRKPFPISPLDKWIYECSNVCI